MRHIGGGHFVRDDEADTAALIDNETIRCVIDGVNKRRARQRRFCQKILYCLAILSVSSGDPASATKRGSNASM